VKGEMEAAPTRRATEPSILPPDAPLTRTRSAHPSQTMHDRSFRINVLGRRPATETLRRNAFSAATSSPRSTANEAGMRASTCKLHSGTAWRSTHVAMLQHAKGFVSMKSPSAITRRRLVSRPASVQSNRPPFPETVWVQPPWPGYPGSDRRNPAEAGLSDDGDPNDAKLEPIFRFHWRVGRASEGRMMSSTTVVHAPLRVLRRGKADATLDSRTASCRQRTWGSEPPPLDHARDCRGSHLTAGRVLRNDRPLAMRHFPR